MKTKRFAFPCLMVCLLAFEISTHAQRAFSSENLNEPCVAGRTAAPVGFWTWPSNSHVNVYLRQPDFSEAEISAVKVAVQNWDLTGLENGSNVRFSFQGLSRETRIAPADVTIVRRAIYDKRVRHLALLEAHSLRNDQLIDYALIVVDTSVNRPEVLTNVIAHELGHSLGLLDCYKCHRKSTAMGLLKTASESNGIEGPTACDRNAVKLAYHELKVHVRPAPGAVALAQPIANQGKDAEEDKTPIVP
jgi:predicted Zn-dependent protease with MMP-like domain